MMHVLRRVATRTLVVGARRLSAPMTMTQMTVETMLTQTMMTRAASVHGPFTTRV